jgi:hypothetical protein
MTLKPNRMAFVSARVVNGAESPVDVTSWAQSWLFRLAVGCIV